MTNFESKQERDRYAALAIVACTLCDDDGYYGTHVCDHIDHRPAARRGMAKVRLALAEAKKRRAQ